MTADKIRKTLLKNLLDSEYKSEDDIITALGDDLFINNDLIDLEELMEREADDEEDWESLRDIIGQFEYKIHNTEYPLYLREGDPILFYIDDKEKRNLFMDIVKVCGYEDVVYEKEYLKKLVIEPKDDFIGEPSDPYDRYGVSKKDFY